MNDWLITLPSCPSTNSWALARLSELPPGTVVFTRAQTAGRGRQGRAWYAPPGTLTASIVVAVPPARAPAMALAAGLAIIHALSDACPQLAARFAIKWPNDVLLAGRKLAGVLCEGSGQQLVVGIGLNRAATLPPELAAISLHTLAAPPSEEELLHSLRRYVLEAAGVIALHGLCPLLPALRARDALLGVSCTVQTNQGSVCGIGQGIDDQGRLLLLTAGGARAIDSGHVLM
ncbi:MAG: biotin--[acetyl-CoA-carboxylase] ligase [Planctomycetota bacterium]|nr:biotin--[acetyl-CoA-carboxylase] ligase [Planctomycetota bacterium]MCX8039626.1 biotin--[acetyl-CoA-carboxylase] ligase [Planctomycetota bacterium]MDW8373079.1 biotin--[acetyl-CoA-carboxylase] ligase [Planctomycetota bacterium]